ncbi:MAG: hypothetical protein OXU61_06165 [Gammaproteobacteria bacterium]|nr:hypothetical protein [Gammaproteobacteria bacterium]
MKGLPKGDANDCRQRSPWPQSVAADLALYTFRHGNGKPSLKSASRYAIEGKRFPPRYSRASLPPWMYSWRGSRQDEGAARSRAGGGGIAAPPSPQRTRKSQLPRLRLKGSGPGGAGPDYAAAPRGEPRNTAPLAASRISVGALSCPRAPARR